MLHARARFALVPSIVAYVAGVCAFVCRILAAAPSRRKAAIVMRTKKESDLPTWAFNLARPVYDLRQVSTSPSAKTILQTAYRLTPPTPIYRVDGRGFRALVLKRWLYGFTKEVIVWYSNSAS